MAAESETQPDLVPSQLQEPGSAAPPENAPSSCPEAARPRPPNMAQEGTTSPRGKASGSHSGDLLAQDWGQAGLEDGGEGVSAGVRGSRAVTQRVSLLSEGGSLKSGGAYGGESSVPESQGGAVDPREVGVVSGGEADPADPAAGAMSPKRDLGEGALISLRNLAIRSREKGNGEENICGSLTRRLGVYSCRMVFTSAVVLRGVEGGS